MRTLLTGASGFVGSNIAKVLTDRHGDEVVSERVDMTDRDAVRAHVDRSGPDAIIHCAILNDWDLMHRQRGETRRRWAEFFSDVDVLLCPVTPVPHEKLVAIATSIVDHADAPTIS